MQKEDMNELSLQEFYTKSRIIIRYLFSKWLTIGFVVVLFGLLGIAFAWMKKPVYIARMSFVTDVESKSGFSAYAGLAAQFGIDLGGGNSSLFEGDNLIELLKSRRLVVQTLLTHTGIPGDNRLMIEYYSQEVIESPGGKSFSNKSGRERDSILFSVADKIISNDLIIDKRDKKLSIIDIEVKSTHENFAKLFTELLAQNAISYYTEYKIKKTRQNVMILERQTDSIRRILYGNIGEVAAITDLNINPIKQVSKTGAQRKQIEVQASGALYAELLKNLELSKMALRKETPLIQIVDGPILPLEKKGLGRLKTGLIFGFIGGLIVVLFLIFRRRLATNYN